MVHLQLVGIEAIPVHGLINCRSSNQGACFQLILPSGRHHAY